MINHEIEESASDLEEVSSSTAIDFPVGLELPDEIPEDTEISEVVNADENEQLEIILEDTELLMPKEFTEDESLENWKRTPINYGEWEGERGQSKWIPDDEDVRSLLKRYGTDGIEYKDNLPNFERFSAFEYDLNDTEYRDSNALQFQYCNEAMVDYFSGLSDEYAGIDCENPLSNEQYKEALLNAFKCDEVDLEDIQAALDIGETPYGYTWHHTETPGRMQLVPSAIHDSARHRGGQTIWGGGNQNR